MNLSNVRRVLRNHFPSRKLYDAYGIKPLQREFAKLQQQWEPYFIIWPRRMRNGSWMWMEDVYRRLSFDIVESKHKMWTVRTRWEYGTIIDVLETI